MKIKDGFILRKVPGMNLVMPTGKMKPERSFLSIFKKAILRGKLLRH